MKIIETIKEIWKENKKGYWVSSIIVCIGAFFIYARFHNKFTFKFIEYLYTLPFALVSLLLFMFLICFIIGGKK